MLLSLTYQGSTFHDVAPDFLSAMKIPDAVVLAAAQGALCVAVDAQAEKLRIVVLTPGAGQAMEYGELKAEAQAALAATAAATPALYPMLAASVGIDIDPSTNAVATDVLGVARAVMVQSAAWTALGAAIRKARVTGKAAIAAASDLASAKAAFAAITWPALPTS